MSTDIDYPKNIREVAYNMALSIMNALYMYSTRYGFKGDNYEIEIWSRGPYGILDVGVIKNNDHSKFIERQFEYKSNGKLIYTLDDVLFFIEALGNLMPISFKMEGYYKQWSACEYCKEIYRTNERCSHAKRDYDEYIKHNSKTPGMIYYARIDNYVKIGYTSGHNINAVNKRVRGMKTGMPKSPEIIFCHPGTPEDESRIHEKLHSERTETGFGSPREWFHYGDLLKNHIEYVRSAYVGGR